MAAEAWNKMFTYLRFVRKGNERESRKWKKGKQNVLKCSGLNNYQYNESQLPIQAEHFHTFQLALL